MRSRARFTGDLLKHEDQCHVANRQIAVRVYLLRSLDPAARVRVVASLGEIRLQSNHESFVDGFGVLEKSGRSQATKLLVAVLSRPFSRRVEK